MSLNKSEVYSNNKNALSESTTINLPPLITKGQNSNSTSDLDASTAYIIMNPQHAYKNKGVEDVEHLVVTIRAY